MNVHTEVLMDLLRRPPPVDAEVIPPPVETRVQKLPFNKLTWKNFERLCARLVTTYGTITNCHLYGVQGEKQQGIDLLAERQFEDRLELWCFQCKRRKTFNPADLETALEQFAFDADRYVVIISCDAKAVLRRMMLQRPNIFLWDAEDLSSQLKNQYDIVEDFFGVVWRRAFCGRRPQEAVQRSRVYITLDDDLSAVDRHKLEKLRQEVAKTLNIEPEEIRISMVVEGSVRIVLELPTPQAEELLARYRQEEPQLAKVLERFRIVQIADLEPPGEPPEPGEPGPGKPPEPGEPGPTESEGGPSTSAPGDTELVCKVCGERFTLTKQEQDFFSIEGAGLTRMTLPERCRQHRQAHGSRSLTLGRTNVDIPNAESGQGCFECFTTADLSEVASWGTTQFPWEEIVPDEPVDSPNTVKFEVDFQVAGVLALEEIPEGGLHVKALEYAPWIDHYINARKALPLYVISDSIRRGYGGAFSIDITPDERSFYESLGFLRESGTDRYYLPADAAYRLVLQEEGVDDVVDFLA
ncbi:MAG: zinc-ribbon domain containing protein [Anaerolineales bacterium]|nr:zinc-ribbon domain containing protein [Anaerolineales bacterium]